MKHSADSTQRVSFVTWTAHARASALGDALGADVFVPGPRKGAVPTVLRYLLQALATVAYLVRARPSVVLFTNPPFVVGLLLQTLRWPLRYSTWCDLHSGAINDPRWARFSALNALMLRGCTGVIAHNEPMARSLEDALGIRSLVVTSPPLAVRQRKVPAGDAPIVATLGYAFDEPVAELLEAARLTPNVSFVFSGSAPAWVQQLAPPNCVASGWLEDSAYRELVASSLGVVCLTTREATMQTGAYEAVEHAVPIILSGTEMLRAYFDRGGVIFVDDHSPTRIAEAVNELVASAEEYRLAAMAAQEEMIARSRSQVQSLQSAVGLPQRAVAS